MDKEKLQKNIEKYNMKSNKAYRSALNAGLLAGILSAGAFASVVIGAGAAAITEGCFRGIAKEVQSRTDYQSSVEAKRNILLDEFCGGRISFEEFTTQYNKLDGSTESVIEYSKENPEDKKLALNVENYKKSKDFADTVLTNSLPLCAGGALVSYAGYNVFKALKKRNDMKKEKAIVELSRSGLDDKEMGE